MLPILSAGEARVIGSLIEKSLVTPDHYPLTLNALTNACNQKTGRNPVTSMTQGEVQRIARTLRERSLLRLNENFRTGVEKYAHAFCNTRYGDLQFDPGELALVCVLLLRGPQTPGELRAHCRRLHDFADNAAVLRSLEGLMDESRGPIVARLPRTPGRKSAEYMHRFSGDVDTDVDAPEGVEAGTAASGGTDLEARVARLEQAVAELRARLDHA